MRSDFSSIAPRLPPAPPQRLIPSEHEPVIRSAPWRWCVSLPYDAFHHMHAIYVLAGAVCEKQRQSSFIYMYIYVCIYTIYIYLFARCKTNTIAFKDNHHGTHHAWCVLCMCAAFLRFCARIARPRRVRWGVYGSFRGIYNKCHCLCLRFARESFGNAAPHISKWVFGLIDFVQG